MPVMKHILITTIAAVLVMGCGESQLPDTSIHQAAYDGNIEAVKQHLASGTDVNAKDEKGAIPLHFAVFKDHKETAELLITKGADVNAKDEYEETALDFADGETAALLRKHGGKTSEELKAEGK
jgi:ankyrin repeat protein